VDRLNIQIISCFAFLSRDIENPEDEDFFPLRMMQGTLFFLRLDRTLSSSPCGTQFPSPLLVTTSPPRPFLLRGPPLEKVMREAPEREFRFPFFPFLPTSLSLVVNLARPAVSSPL